MHTRSDGVSLLPLAPEKVRDKNARIEILDVIKALALFGIFVLHVIGPFSGWQEYLLPEQKQQLATAEYDLWIYKAAHLLLTGKCRGVFSFLFGLAFYFQLQQAVRQGGDFRTKFLKRLALLFCFGLLHAYLLFAGDVLRYYAFCGLFLLLVYQWPARRILVAGILCLTLLPAVFIVLTSFFPFGSLDFQKWQEVRDGFTGNSYVNLIKVNFFLDWRSQLHVFYKGRFVGVLLGQLLLGLWAGKICLFLRLKEFQRVFVLLFFAAMGLAGCCYSITYSLDKVAAWQGYPQLLAIADNFFFMIGNQALIVGYICGITCLFQIPFCRPLLACLAPAGRMSLSNYLLQSVIGALVFYGVGLGHFGRLGPAWSIPLSLVIFAGQVFFSHYWLRHFGLGPFEWLFRLILAWQGPEQNHQRAGKVPS